MDHKEFIEKVSELFDTDSHYQEIYGSIRHFTIQEKEIFLQHLCDLVEDQQQNDQIATSPAIGADSSI